MKRFVLRFCRVYVSRTLFTRPVGGPSSSATAALSETTTGHPFSSLLEQLGMRPFKRAEFTPEDFFSRKRALALEGDSNENRSKRACVAGQTAVPVLNGAAEAGGEEGEVVLDEKEVDRLVGSTENDALEVRLLSGALFRSGQLIWALL
jgi:DNA repair protein RAD5